MALVDPEHDFGLTRQQKQAMGIDGQPYIMCSEWLVGQ